MYADNFRKHYEDVKQSVFEELLIKCKKGDYDEISQHVSLLDDLGCFPDIYNKFITSLLIKQGNTLNKLFEDTELDFDMNRLKTKQEAYLANLSEFEADVLDNIGLILYISHIGYPLLKEKTDLYSISFFIEQIQKRLTKCLSSKISNQSLHSLMWSLFKPIDCKIRQKLEIYLKDFPYEHGILMILGRKYILLTDRQASLCEELFKKSLTSLTLYSTTLVRNRFKFLTNKNNINLHVGFADKAISLLFNFINKLNLDQQSTYSLFKAITGSTFDILHQEINKIFCLVNSDKELNKELANYCWVSYTCINAIEVQYRVLCETIDFNMIKNLYLSNPGKDGQILSFNTENQKILRSYLVRLIRLF